MMSVTDLRQRLRGVLAGAACVSPATVFDALSARVAESVGYEIGLLSGSVSGATLLAAPDIGMQTLTEFAAQVRQIMRVSRLSVVLDADNGYGNALNVMRAVQELEHAGASAIMIEDTVVPERFGASALELVSIEEMKGKLRAAIGARIDQSLLIVGRIAALKVEDTRRTAERARAYESTGVDALFLTGLKSLDEFDAVRASVKLPIIVGLAPALKREELAARGVRLLLQGHQPVAATVKALHEVYSHLYRGGTPDQLKPVLASPEQMKQVVRAGQYQDWQKRYLS